MSNIFHIFTGEPIPAQEDSDFVQEWMDTNGWSFLNEVQELTESQNEDDFRAQVKRIRELVEEWDK